MNDINKKAQKAGMWYSIGNIFLKGCVFVSLPIFTRLLNTNDFGIYNTYIAYEGLITAILGLGLYGTIKSAKLDFKEKFNEYISSILSLSIIFFVIILILANIFSDILCKFTGFNKIIINCLFFQSFGSYLIYFYGSKLNIEFKYKSYILISFINTIGNILLSILLIIFIFPNEKYIGRIMGSAIPLILIGMSIILYVMLTERKIFSKIYWKYALAIGLPLVPHVISQSLLSQFDRIMITNFIGSSESGIYSYIYTICTIMYVIATSFDNAWSPWVFITLNQKDNVSNIKSSSKDYIKFYTTLLIGFICIMPEITKIIASKEYWDGLDLIIPLSLANYFIFLYFIPVNIEYYYKKTKYISIGTFGVSILNAILNYVVLNKFGYKLAAYTTLLSYICLFIFHWKIAQRFNIDSYYDFKFIIKNSIFLIIVSIIILIFEKTFTYNIVIRYIIITIILILYYRNRYKFFKILKKEKK